MTRNYKTFSEDLTDDTYERYQEPEPEPEVKRGKRIFTVQTRKINNKWVHEVVGIRSAK